MVKTYWIKLKMKDIKFDFHSLVVRYACIISNTRLVCEIYTETYAKAKTH